MSSRKPIWGSHQVWWNISRFVWEYVMNFWQEENWSEYIQIFGKNNNCLIWNIHCHFGVSVTYWYSGIFEDIDTKFEVTVVASDSLTSPKTEALLILSAYLIRAIKINDETLPNQMPKRSLSCPLSWTSPLSQMTQLSATLCNLWCHNRVCVAKLHRYTWWMWQHYIVWFDRNWNKGIVNIHFKSTNTLTSIDQPSLNNIRNCEAALVIC